MAFIDVHDIGQIATLIGIPSIMLGLFMQIRSYRKDQKEQQEKNRKDITTEINARTEELLKNVELRLDAIKIAAVLGKDELMSLKAQLGELRSYVTDLDKEGTVEWQKTKPFIVEKIETLATRITELEKRFIIEVTDLKQDNKEIKKEHERRG